MRFKSRHRYLADNQIELLRQATALEADCAETFQMTLQRIGSERNCFCCGTPESNSGCVVGPRCNCRHVPNCEVCKHCFDHHAKGCTEEVRLEAIRLIAELRQRHKINIFDYGENEGDKTLEAQRHWKEFADRRL